MGKSGRTKQQKEAEALARQEKLIAQKKAEQRLNRITAAVSVSVIAVVIIAVSLYLGINALLDNGYFLRKNISVSSKNYEINNAMVSYFFYEEYRDFINENYESLEEMKLSSEKSLKKQHSYYKDGSWYDHFMKLTEENIKELTALCEEADANGMELEETELDEIDYLIDKMKENAEAGGRTELEYYEYMYGRGVTEKDVRECLTLELLAEKYKEKLLNEYTVSDSDYEAEYNENPEQYNNVTALVYTFKYEESYKALSESSTGEECINAINSDVIKNYAENYETELNDDLVELLVTGNMTESYSYGDNGIIDKFGFAKTAEQGDFYLEKTDEGCTAYVLKSAPARDEYTTKNVRIIYSANDTYGGESYAQSFINNLYDEVSEAENLTNRFKTLAVTYSEDLASKLNYGGYKNLKTGVLESAAEEWIFSQDRKAGDCQIIAGSEGQYLILFEGDGLTAWKSSVYENKAEDYLKKHIEELTEKYNVISNEKNLKKISI